METKRLGEVVKLRKAIVDLQLKNIKCAVVIPPIAMTMLLLKSVKQVPYLLPPQNQKIYGVSTEETGRVHFYLVILLKSVRVNLFVVWECGRNQYIQI